MADLVYDKGEEYALNAHRFGNDNTADGNFGDNVDCGKGTPFAC